VCFGLCFFVYYKRGRGFRISGAKERRHAAQEMETGTGTAWRCRNGVNETGLARVGGSGTAWGGETRDPVRMAQHRAGRGSTQSFVSYDHHQLRPGLVIKKYFKIFYPIEFLNAYIEY
jgi:hypothetical protein